MAKGRHWRRSQQQQQQQQQQQRHCGGRCHPRNGYGHRAADRRRRPSQPLLRPSSRHQRLRHASHPQRSFQRSPFHSPSRIRRRHHQRQYQRQCRHRRPLGPAPPTGPPPHLLPRLLPPLPPLAPRRGHRLLRRDSCRSQLLRTGRRCLLTRSDQPSSQRSEGGGRRGRLSFRGVRSPRRRRLFVRVGWVEGRSGEGGSV
mmetsp:Transcript_24401/g.51195  ORF Transcript_24401/g.51195 Transcript_24401/m.51195 type:complete len:200 (-) Transcript_24401:226-825(-)